LWSKSYIRAQRAGRTRSCHFTMSLPFGKRRMVAPQDFCLPSISLLGQARRYPLPHLTFRERRDVPPTPPFPGPLSLPPLRPATIPPRFLESLNFRSPERRAEPASRQPTASQQPAPCTGGSPLQFPCSSLAVPLYFSCPFGGISAATPITTAPLCLRLTARAGPLFKVIALSPGRLARCRPALLSAQAQGSAFSVRSLPCLTGQTHLRPSESQVAAQNVRCSRSLGRG